jgi:arylsulfatase A-like enzyme
LAARPNVLVVMADQMKATASHLYGNRFCATPGMERLAARGTRFDTAITPQPLCVPARVALWTGAWPHATGARRNETPMPPGAAHAFRVWKEAGFHTALIGKDHCFADPADHALFDVRCTIGHEGLPEGGGAHGMPWVVPEEAVHAAHAVRRAMPRQGAAVSYAVSDVDPEAASSGLVAAQTEAWLRARAAAAANGDEQPFAAWVSFPDPHTPYEVPRAWADTVPPDAVDLPPREAEGADLPERTRVLQRINGVDDVDEADLRGLIATYHAQVRFVDDGLRRILEALEATGLAERTLVVFCADHGDFAGEHGMTRKGGALYDCLVRVPLILAGPGVPAGAVEEAPVSLVDVVPTLLALQGLPVPASMQGRPLPTATEAPARAEVFAEYGAGGPACTRADLDAAGLGGGLEAGKATLRWREAEGRRKLVRTRRWAYASDPTADPPERDELYDLAADPGQLRNVAAEPAHAAVIADLRARLLAWSLATEPAVPLPEPLLQTGSTKGSSA